MSMDAGDAMRAMRAMSGIEGGDARSGTFETNKPSDPVLEAHQLACEIERLLVAPTEGEAYGRRLARALARSLIDQLEELAREPRTKRTV
ncbi:MAG TPA: hypothetical protein VGI39_22165 [Polyangiaceae bacterium]|jgi:hypothetical protein